jgi:uncharacterized protein (TIGR02145 family)
MYRKICANNKINLDKRIIMKHVFTVFTSLLLLFVSGAHAQQWTWLTGGNTPNVLPNYVDDPGGRQKCSMWAGHDGILYLFGGDNFDSNFVFGDLWSFDTSTTEWTWIAGSSSPNSPGIYGVLGESQQGNQPGSRKDAASWVDSQGNLWLFGGVGYGVTSELGRLNDLWKYDPVVGLWTWISGSNQVNIYGNYGETGVPSNTNMPGTRGESAHWISNDELYLFGGNGQGDVSNGYLKDLWKYSISENQWVHLGGGGIADVAPNYGELNASSSTNHPGTRVGSCNWISSDGTKLYLFGGAGGAWGGVLNDLWQYDLSTNNWTWIGGTSTTGDLGSSGELGVPSINNRPAGRLQAVSFAQNNYLWLFGGYTNYYINDLWRYNITTGEWTWMGGEVNGGDLGAYLEQGPSSLPNYPSNKEGAQGCVSDNGKFWLFGGTGSVGGVMNDLWKLEVAPDAPMMTCIPLPANLQQGLVGYWPFCGNANDESGNGNDGVVNGATLTEDRFGNAGSAYELNGSDEYISVSSDSIALLPSEQITLSVWFKIDADGAYSGNNLLGPIMRSRFYGYVVWYDSLSTSIQVITHHDNNGEIIGSDTRTPAGVNDNNWHLLTSTFNGDVSNLYLDGALVDSYDISGNLYYVPDGIVAFGKDGNNPSPLTAHYAGSLDDIAIWNRALTAEEITELFSDYSPLVTYYLDNDGDTFGDPNSSVETNTGMPVGYSSNNVDCDDTNALINIPEHPIFNSFGPFCAGSDIPSLPTISANGLEGNWSPEINNLETTTYTFTPNINQCAYPGNYTVEILPIPQVSIINSVSCVEQVATITAIVEPLGNYEYNWLVPAEVPNPGNVASFSTSIDGLYSVVVSSACFDSSQINTQNGDTIIGCDGSYFPVCGCDGETYANACYAYTQGITHYSFGECSGIASFYCPSTEATTEVSIQTSNTPTFGFFGPYCSGSSIPTLPTTSQNGISGSWSPTINSQETTSYTFTPDAGQCASSVTRTITITPTLTPSFGIFGPYCAGSSIPGLPTTSTNGITGNWSPAINNQETTTYTFTPNAGQCASSVTRTITITPTLTPSFGTFGPYCAGSSIPGLPTTSTNGITGNWSPAINNQETTTYTFTPNAGQCASSITRTISIAQTVITCYLDEDNDGWGIEETFIQTCDCPAGYSDILGDCDDTNNQSNPAASEVCLDQIDNNCNIEIDEECVLGCTSFDACNFDWLATIDDGSCAFNGEPCDDGDFMTMDDIIMNCFCGEIPVDIAAPHICGANSVHNPNLPYSIMTDQEGNVYRTIIIGEQEWMAENLKTSTYRNGDTIPLVTDDSEWSTLNTGAYCFYNNDETFNCPFGKLYNWYTVVDSRNVCPVGWHVPTDDELSLLVNYLDPDADGGNNTNASGGKMKSFGLQYWTYPNLSAANGSGFSGLPGGARYPLGPSSSLNYIGYWWSSTEGNSNYAWARVLDSNSGSCHRWGPEFSKRFGFSVRCLRDNNTGLIPGCTDMFACNYNSSATEDDGSCQFSGSPCDDANASTINDIIDASCGCVGTPIELGVEHTCGADFVHNPSLTYGSMTDQEGNVYKTIVIGDQEWMAENLNTSIYRNGDAIVTGMTNEEWSTTDVGAWAYQFDNSAISCPYGKLYNWFACVDSRNLCPTGWHVPSDGDWAIMIEYLGGEWEAGWSMKSTGSSFNGTGLWSSWNEEATNSSGFSAIPGGVRSYSGIYNWYGQTGYWWSSSESGPDNAWVRFLNINMVNSGNDNGGNKKDGFSVRCLRDSDTGLIPGCLDLLACNYNPDATEEDGSCYYPGCIDPLALNYNPLAGCNDGSCIYTPIPGCTDPLAFNYNPQANQNEGCLYTASVFVYNDLNGNGDHESNEPGLSNWPVVGNDINGLLWTNGNGNAFVAVPQGAYQFTVLNTTDNWVSTTPTSATLDLPTGPATASFGLQVIPGEAIVAAGPFTGFWDILHCTDGYESGVYLENIGSQTVSGFMTLTCDPLFTPNASSYFTTPPAETGPGYAVWNIDDFLPGEYELLSYFVPGPGVEYLNAVFNFSLELTLLDPQGNIIYDETWDASPIVACAYDPNDLTGYPEGLDSPHDEGYTIEHFMRPDNMVEFRVRFQNTGTLPAEDIDIYIPIDASVWDLSTIEPLARAADMQVICLHDSGDNFFNLYDSLEHELPEGVSATDLLIFSFEDIFLPDSASDPDGSQGYVFFQMQAKHGLDVNTELNAQAFIYFEQNPPITTNETYHVIFDCESFTPMVGDTEICDGESLIFDATQPYVDAYEWQLNNVVIGSANTLQYPAEVGTYTLELNTKNVLCPQGENHDVTVIVHEIPELNLPLDATLCEGQVRNYEAESNGSVTWSNGANTGDTFTADQSFTVTATAIGEGNCSTSEDWMVTVNPLPSAAVDSANFVLTAIDGVAWQWSVNGAVDATTQSITATENGNYQVAITNEFGCVAISDVIEVELPSSVFVHSWSTLHLYPNPMTTGARLELPQGTFDVALYDITGACIRTLTQQQGTVVIERESLASGVYQVRATQGTKSSNIRLVVK